MEKNRLDSLQREVLSAFFERERRFFLTGGAALAGYYLGHRATHDLDLFTTEDRMEDGVAALTETAGAVGASMEALRTSPGGDAPRPGRVDSRCPRPPLGMPGAEPWLLPVYPELV